MNHKELENLAAQVTPQNARSYALAKGWRRVPDVNGDIALFDRGNAGLDQLIIPLQSAAPDYARRIIDVVTNLAEVEHRSAEQILSDLLQSDADVLRYTISSPTTEKGDLPLEDGIRILEGAKRSILAAACSVVSPAKHHPRMSRTEATQLLDACRLQQAERGSYTIAIACPLRAVETEQPLFERSFARLTAELLMRSAHRLVQAIETDKVPSVYEDQPAGAEISANFCDAILRMHPKDEKSILTISVTWASAFPPSADKRIPQTVRFQNDYFPIIEDIYKKLRPSEEAAASLFVGLVDTLNGDVGDDGRVQGDTRFLIFFEEEVVRARTDLKPDDYQKAIDAHRNAQMVKFKGVLHLGRRTHKISDVQDFEILSPS